MDIKDRKEPIELFCCYADEDQLLLVELKKHLNVWEQNGLIALWTDMNISPGSHREEEIIQHLNKAQIILLLISKDFIQSKYYDSTEMKLALEKYKCGEVRIIPIILHYCVWKETPLGQLQALPKDAKPITGSGWHNQDEAFTDVAQGIRRVVEELAQQTKDDTGAPYHFSTERMRLVNLYLKNVMATSSQLPWGDLPGVFASGMEIDDVYVPPSLSSKVYRPPNVMDEWSEREILRQEKGGNKRREKLSYTSLYEIVQSEANATLLGYMGTGKSMAANYIALRLARGEGQSIFGLSKSKIPVLLHLGRMRETPSSDLFTFAIENSIANFGLATTLKDILRQEWNKGNILLVLDALDEFRGDKSWISEQIVRLGDRNLHRSSVLLTSRPSTYIPMVGLKAFTLKELQSEEISGFVETWTTAILKITGQTDLKPRDHAQSLTHDIGRHPLVQEIVSNQLLLAILTILSLQPGGIRVEEVTEAQLLNTYVNRVIDRQKNKGEGIVERYGTDLLKIVFSYVGFEVQRAQSGMFAGMCTRSSLLHTLPDWKYLKSLGNARADTEAMLDFWLSTGLIQRIDDGMQSVRFRHLAFQYLGAALTLTYQSEERAEQIWTSVEKNEDWRAVRRLYLNLKAHPTPL